MKNLKLQVGQQMVCLAKTWDLIEWDAEVRSDESYPLFQGVYTIEAIIVIPGTDQVYLTFAELQNPRRYRAANSDSEILYIPVMFDYRFFSPLLRAQLNDLLTGAGITPLS